MFTVDVQKNCPSASNQFKIRKKTDKRKSAGVQTEFDETTDGWWWARNRVKASKQVKVQKAANNGYKRESWEKSLFSKWRQSKRK